MTTPVEEVSAFSSSWSTTTIETARAHSAGGTTSTQSPTLYNRNQLHQTSEVTSQQGNRVKVEGTPVVRVAGMDKWEGLILEIDDELMTAELTPLDRTGPNLVADFQTELLGEDARVAEPGDVFYLTVRTVRDRSGYPTRTEQLRLRRLGLWTEDEVTRLSEQAATRMEQIEDLFG